MCRLWCDSHLANICRCRTKTRSNNFFVCGCRWPGSSRTRSPCTCGRHGRCRRPSISQWCTWTRRCTALIGGCRSSGMTRKRSWRTCGLLGRCPPQNTCPRRTWTRPCTTWRCGWCCTVLRCTPCSCCRTGVVPAAWRGKWWFGARGATPRVNRDTAGKALSGQRVARGKAAWILRGDVQPQRHTAPLAHATPRTCVHTRAR